MTDEFSSYHGLGNEFASHETVNHKEDEYVRSDVCTDTAESWFALFKRGVQGTFHHASKQHLDRYVDEFAFRWNHRHVDNATRAVNAMRRIEGKRLYYRMPRQGD